jgi:peptide/nickel transport system substrate-binding protein
LLRYDPTRSLNPITSMSSDNILLCSLMYEPLFALDDNFVASPVLCASWTTVNETTYVFTIKPDIAMSDGSRMTADDVAYTFRQARQSGRFINHLAVISNIVSDGELTVTITLRSPTYRFVNLLDVPIIKNGSMGNNVPPGSGPYYYVGEPVMRLERFYGHKDYASLPITTVYLAVCEDNELTEMFDDGGISLLWDDPSDTFEIRLNRIHETRYYNTTALQFIGFNGRKPPMRDPLVRRAIGWSVDRAYIVENIMPGQAIAAPLALSPAYNRYDPEWEEPGIDPVVEMSALLAQAGLDDYDFDSFLEYPDLHGGYVDFTIEFIVNRENVFKVRAAQRITEGLRRTGLDVVLRELQWDNFNTALREGNFDMFYGETVLSADFDLSPLLMSGGSLDYGGMGSSEYKWIVDDFLLAQTPVGQSAAALQLVREVRREAPFVPILYKRYAVYTPTGAVSNATPLQSGVLLTFMDWTINLSMLT